MVLAIEAVHPIPVRPLEEMVDIETLTILSLSHFPRPIPPSAFTPSSVTYLFLPITFLTFWRPSSSSLYILTPFRHCEVHLLTEDSQDFSEEEMIRTCGPWRRNLSISSFWITFRTLPMSRIIRWIVFRVSDPQFVFPKFISYLRRCIT